MAGLEIQWDELMTWTGLGIMVWGQGIHWLPAPGYIKNAVPGRWTNKHNIYDVTA